MPVIHWKPTSEAPRDGTKIRVPADVGGKELGDGITWVVSWNGSCWWAHEGLHGFELFNEPTRWTEYKD